MSTTVWNLSPFIGVHRNTLTDVDTRFYIELKKLFGTGLTSVETMDRHIKAVVRTAKSVNAKRIFIGRFAGTVLSCRLEDALPDVEFIYMAGWGQ